MKASEAKIIEQLHELLIGIKKENEAFRDAIIARVEKTERTRAPINLEADILSTTQKAVAEAIQTVMTKYDSPMIKLVKEVVEGHSSELRNVINDSFVSVIRTEEFKAAIVSAFAHKVARTVISNASGLFDKVTNELKQDAAFKARLTLAVEKVVEETMKERTADEVQR